MRHDLAWTGGASLTAGLLIGIIVQRLTQDSSVTAAGTVPAIPRMDRTVAEPPPAETTAVTDVLERYRIAAAF